MRPAAQLKGGCVCTVENLGRKKWKRKYGEGDSSQQRTGDSSERGLPHQRQQAGLWIVGLLLDSWVQLMGGQTLWKSACLPAASCCVQRPAVTAQGSELIARAGSSMGWMECSEVDFSEVVCTVQQQQSTAGTHCILFREKKNGGERREITIIVILPLSPYFLSFCLSFLSFFCSSSHLLSFLFFSSPREWWRKWLSCRGDKLHWEVLWNYKASVSLE